MSRIDVINERIQREVCHETINELSTQNLLDEYKCQKSTINKINKLANILSKFHVSESDEIIGEFIDELIPPGTKGVICGNKFNTIVREKILHMGLSDDYEIKFETRCHIETSEIPDWYIKHVPTERVLVGMNQLSLWGGGHQLNRGAKYLFDCKYNTENSRLVCVVCNDIVLKSTKNKTYKIFDVGFRNNTLCYLGGLPRVITEYFDV